MSILAWIEEQKKLKLLNAPKYNHPTSDRSKGLWTRCDHCGVILYIKHLKKNKRVCFGCGYHLQMNSEERITHLVDSGTWRALDETLSPCDPLEFWDQKAYIERLKASQHRTGLQDAVQTGTGMLDGIPVALGVMDFYFMGGSMGSVVGEKITRLIEYATQEGLTLILVCASGGARMQEGVLSLMQMAKISAALQIYQNCAHLLYISVVTSPTTGGVTASFAMLGDLILSEPKALIGFAGKRVIEQTLALQEELPENFQTAEYVFNHGLLDLIIPRSFLKGAIFEMITFYKNAPLKRLGNIPYGIQQNLNCITEEKIRRKWYDYKQQKKSGEKSQNHSIGKNTKQSEYFNALSSSKTNLENKNTNYKDSFSEFGYREILTSFQIMFDFFSLSSVSTTKLNTQNNNKKNIFNENVFNKFISKFSSQNIVSFNNELSKLDTTWANKSNKENHINNNITPQSIINREILEWRMLYSSHKNLSKEKFIETFINTKQKNFFYKSLI